MLLAPIVTVFLMASSVTAAPTNSSVSPAVDQSIADDDPLEVSDTRHSMRRRLWRRLLKQVSGMGLGGVYGLGGNGLNFLSQLAHFQSPNNCVHCGPHRGPTVYGGVAGGGGGYGSNTLHYPTHHVGGGSHGGYHGGHPGGFYVNNGQGGVPSASFGPWDSGAWGLFGNYGLGGSGDGLHFETVWL